MKSKSTITCEMINPASDATPRNAMKPKDEPMIASPIRPPTTPKGTAAYTSSGWVTELNWTTSAR